MRQPQGAGTLPLQLAQQVAAAAVGQVGVDQPQVVRLRLRAGEGAGDGVGQVHVCW